MQKNPSLYLHHIIDSATQINDYLSGSDKQQFADNALVQDAVLRKLEVIGEACSSLEENFKQTHQNIPWRKISGMRNRLTHEYWDVDLDIVWHTVTIDVPALKSQLINLLEKVDD